MNPIQQLAAQLLDEFNKQFREWEHDANAPTHDAATTIREGFAAMIEVGNLS